MRKTAVSSSDIRQRILIIEDDSKMMKMLEDGIAGQGYQVETAGTAEEGFFLVHRFRPDLLVLDLHLPKRSGMEILRQIRSQGTDVRVLILTSQNSADDRVIGLEAGADDYLGKPFSFPELLARIRTLQRRRPVAAAQNAVEVADLSLDTNARVARRAGKTLDLTTREFDLLLFLAEHQNQTVSREMLARDVWQENARFTPIDNVIDVQMNRLRRKVDDPFPSKLLHTIRGIGFILKEPSA
jgi:two-component system copper resistance phosphate regulon response regulator CusR